MLNSPILETVLSLVLVIFIFSVLVTCVQEGFVTITKSRGKMLEFAIGEVLNDKFNKNFAYLLYQHPQVDLLRKKQGELPTYIDAETFTRALIDLIAKESTETIYEESPDKKSMIKKERFTQPALERAALLAQGERLAGKDPATVSLADRFRLGAESLQYSDLKKLVLSFIANTTKKDGVENIEELKTQIQNWYNAYMDRVTGWYKRKVRKNIFLAAAIVTLFFNLNFITLSKTIHADTKLRKTLVAIADSVSKEEKPISALQERIKKDSAALGDINPDALVGVELPIGWKISVTDAGTEGRTWLGRIFRFIGYFFENHFNFKNITGWLIFILCLSLGAPFWFDVMKKLVNIRNAGISPQKKTGA
jgi:hypothetical protein